MKRQHIIPTQVLIGLLIAGTGVLLRQSLIEPTLMGVGSSIAACIFSILTIVNFTRTFYFIGKIDAYEEFKEKYKKE